MSTNFTENIVKQKIMHDKYGKSKGLLFCQQIAEPKWKCFMCNCQNVTD